LCNSPVKKRGAAPRHHALATWCVVNSVAVARVCEVSDRWMHAYLFVLCALPCAEVISKIGLVYKCAAVTFLKRLRRTTRQMCEWYILVMYSGIR
jgi:hypothetical protein